MHDPAGQDTHTCLRTKKMDLDKERRSTPGSVGWEGAWGRGTAGVTVLCPAELPLGGSTGIRMQRGEGARRAGKVLVGLYSRDPWLAT